MVLIAPEGVLAQSGKTLSCAAEGARERNVVSMWMDGWMNQDYSRLSTTHGHITDCKLLVCMYWTRLVASMWIAF